MKPKEKPSIRVSEIRVKSRGPSTSHLRPRTFQKDDMVLLWDKRKEKPGKHGKFDSLWMGPYIIHLAHNRVLL
jgi:hypothetical protein